MNRFSCQSIRSTVVYIGNPFDEKEVKRFGDGKNLCNEGFMHFTFDKFFFHSHDNNL